jgi:hypothetical protein
MPWDQLGTATTIGSCFVSAYTVVRMWTYGLEKPSLVMQAWTVAATSGVYGSPRLFDQLVRHTLSIGLLDNLHWQRVSREEQNDVVSLFNRVLF